MKPNLNVCNQAVQYNPSKIKINAKLFTVDYQIKYAVSWDVINTIFKVTMSVIGNRLSLSFIGYNVNVMTKFPCILHLRLRSLKQKHE
jgi:hypothetical protein